MRILLTTHQFLPDYASGTEILALHTALELKGLGHEVAVFTAIPDARALPDAERFDHYDYDGIPVTRFRHAHAAMGSQDNIAELEYDNRLVAARFREMIETVCPDVVHFFHLARISASVVNVCTARGIPTVLTPTDFWLVCPLCQLRLPDGGTCPGPDRSGANCVRHIAFLKMPGPVATALNALPNSAVSAMVRIAALAPLRHIRAARQVAALSRRAGYLRDIMNRIDCVLVPTRFMQETLQRHGLDPAHVIYCPYGIRLPLVPANPPQKDGLLTIGYIGTLAEHKGVHILIQAVRALAGCELRVKIYGGLSDYPGYVRRLRQLADGDPRVAFCGTFSNDSIGSVLAELDILAVPSIWIENAPLVVYSAQAAALPVVASDVEGIAEVVADGVNGLLFPAGDAGRLAGILAGLAKDREQAARLARNARRPKTIAQYADNLLTHYHQVIKSGRKT